MRRHEQNLLIIGLAGFALGTACCGLPIACVVGTRDQAVDRVAQSAPSESRPSQSFLPQAATSPPLAEAPPRITSPPERPRQSPSAEPVLVLAPVAAPEFRPRLESREWVSSEGGFRTSARFLGLDDGKARLEKPDGAVAAVPMSKLSAFDRQYVKNAIRTDPIANVIIGKIVGVTDGDTITALDEDNHQVKVRLEGIDAPESNQAFGNRAKQALSEKVFGKSPWIEWREKDKYGRTLGHVFVDGRHVNLELVAEGLAWHYKEYSSDVKFANAELVARRRRAGLWRDDNPTAPWDFRHGTPAAAASPNSLGSVENSSSAIGTTVYVTGTGSKYHAAGCRFLAKSSIPIALSEARAKYGPCSVCKPPR